MIFSIDFDGTIVAEEYPAIGQLNSDAEKFIMKIQKRGHKWILNTMREGDKLCDALGFLREHGLYPDEVNDNLKERATLWNNNPRKVYADVYIDNHNAGGLLWLWEKLGILRFRSYYETQSNKE